MTDTAGEDPSALPQELERRALLVVDLVESVRLMEANEADTIFRWRQLIQHVRDALLPRFEGRLVKSLGDGMLMEFGTARDALGAALALRDFSADGSGKLPPARQFHLRMGLHVAQVIRDELDLFGAGVNLAARLAGAGAPDEVLLSADFRDECLEDLDARFEDLGEIHLKHVAMPVHAVRAERAHAWTAQNREPAPDLVVRSAGLAVLPLDVAADADQESKVVAILVVDALTGRLAAQKDLKVISRLSTQGLAGRDLSCSQLGGLLGCDYLVSGRLRAIGGQLMLHIELNRVRGEQLIWAERLFVSSAELLVPDDPCSAAIAEKLVQHVTESELRRAVHEPMPTIPSCALQYAGVGLMHRSPLSEFHQAGHVFNSLIDRHPRAATPRALLAQWHVLRVTRGLTTSPQEEAERALAHTRVARLNQPEHALALAVEGFVHCHMNGDLDLAEERIRAAIDCKPSESLAWLYLCVVQGFRDQGEAAWVSAQRALALSPLDPMQAYFDALAASAALAAKRLQACIELGDRALRRNRNHVPTLRATTIALVESGDLPRARELAQRVLAMEPGFSTRLYLERAPKGSARHLRERYAAALQLAGIPH